MGTMLIFKLTFAPTGFDFAWRLQYVEAEREGLAVDVWRFFAEKAGIR